MPNGVMFSTLAEMVLPRLDDFMLMRLDDFLTMYHGTQGTAILSFRSILLLRQFLDVAFVLGAWRCLLVPYEVVETDKGHLNASIVAPDNVGARLLVGDTVDLVDQVDPGRDGAESQNVSDGHKRFERQIFFVEAERDERLPEAAGVVLAHLEEHVDVFREPRMPVIGHGVSAHDHVLNAVLFEQSQQFFEVGMDIHIGTSLLPAVVSQLRPDAPRASDCASRPDPVWPVLREL